MKYVTIRVPSIMARDILRFMEARVKEMQAEVSDLQAQAAQVRALAAEAAPASEIKRHASGRAPRGASQGVLVKFLKDHSKENFTMKELAGRIGATLATTCRALNRMLVEEKVLNVDGRWQWNVRVKEAV